MLLGGEVALPDLLLCDGIHLAEIVDGVTFFNLFDCRLEEVVHGLSVVFAVALASYYWCNLCRYNLHSQVVDKCLLIGNVVECDDCENVKLVEKCNLESLHNLLPLFPVAAGVLNCYLFT